MALIGCPFHQPINAIRKELNLKWFDSTINEKSNLRIYYSLNVFHRWLCLLCLRLKSWIIIRQQTSFDSELAAKYWLTVHTAITVKTIDGCKLIAKFFSNSIAFDVKWMELKIQSQPVFTFMKNPSKQSWEKNAEFSHSIGNVIKH